VVNHGTNLEYNRSATWGEIDIFKLKDGRIAEIWSVENTYSELKQLGYEIAEPIRETV
jgi:predicted SnoaL-like aldol condensation-catalyzing enzyme